MDHLALPLTTDGYNTFLKVPYVCNEMFTYDDCGMLTYPARVGVDAYRLREGGYSMEEVLELGPFLQSWLWFGLLGEALGVGNRLDREQRITSRASFVQQEASGHSFLDTSQLDKFIKDASEKGQAPMFQLFYGERLGRCIDMATRTIESICDVLLQRHSTSSFKIDDTSHSLITISLSIQVLVATLLRYSKRLVLQPHLLLSQVSALTLIPGTRIVDRILLQTGWPMCHVSQLPLDILFRFYVSFVRPIPRLLGHHKCSEGECYGNQMEEPIIQPKHITSNCDCESIETPLEEVARLINADQIPLIRYSADVTGYMKLQAFPQAMDDFTAISHVRSSGLGNTLSSSLPTCQIVRIQGIANMLSNDGADSACFWIDTLCVPLERKERKRALSQARKIFQSATNVIVIEPSLSHHDPASAQESLVRIKFSPWTRRLWTTQEGALARNLQFLFKTGPRSLEALLSEFQATSIEQRILEGPKPFEHSLEDIVFKLALLDNDLKLANKLLEGENYDKSKLRIMLRLGYLSLPQMRIFAENRELLESEIVMEALERVYGGLNLGINPEQSVLSMCKSKLLQRLQELAITDLKQERVEVWDYEQSN